MLKKLTAALLVSCMLLQAPAEITFASSNANAETMAEETDAETNVEAEQETTDPEESQTEDSADAVNDQEDANAADTSEDGSVKEDNANTVSENPVEEDAEDGTRQDADEAGADALTEVDGTQETGSDEDTAMKKESAQTDDENAMEADVPETSVIDDTPDEEQMEETVTESDTEFSGMSVEEQYACLLAAESEDEIKEMLSTLPEEEINALYEYVTEQNQANESSVNIETNVVTDAGPFLSPVNIAAKMMRAFRVAGNAGEDSDGLHLSKSAQYDDEKGFYKICLEAFTDGEVTSETKSVPTDIVLVLDQSGSMAYNFNGDETYDNSSRRQYALKNSVKNFIDSVAEKYSSEADHRIAIVTFASDSRILSGWTSVNETGKAQLKGQVNNLPSNPSGATRVDTGMKTAESLMGNGYNYTGFNTERNKVVIVFTDGVPTTSSDFDTKVADDAISSAYNLKNSGVTVYSIGIFNGANPDELYGEKWAYTLFDDIICTGEEGSYWGGSWVSSIFGNNDFAGIDIAAGNRFLNYLSTNYEGTDEIGLTRGTFNPGDHVWELGNGTGYRIDKNFDRTAPADENYYLTANDADSLNKIFEEISSNISSPFIELGEDAVVRDIITPYFELPKGMEGTIKIYTAACTGADSNGAPVFADKVEVTDGSVSAEVSGQTVDVKGFDFDENFVTAEEKADGTYGKKLIIEFYVQPKDAFLGGNQVPTNESNSGVYDSENSLIESFELPTADVPIKSISVNAENKHVYLMDDLSEQDLKDSVTIMVDGKEIDPGELTWEDDYVNINITVPAGGFDNLTEDTSYSASCSIEPAYQGTCGSKTGSDAGDVYVYKPVITFKDSTVWYGDKAPVNPDYYNTNNLVLTEWMHESEKADTSNMGPAPALILDYEVASNVFTAGQDPLINTKEDISVNIADVWIDADQDISVTDHTTFDHEDCVPACEFDKDEEEFLLHVNTCSLTIAKEGDNLPDDPYIFTIQKDGEDYTAASITGAGIVTISELPVGVYTVTEDQGWSWRYDAVMDPSDGTAVLGSNNPSAVVTCTNTKTDDQWLNDYSPAVVNIYDEPHENAAEGGNN